MLNTQVSGVYLQCFNYDQTLRLIQEAWYQNLRSLLLNVSYHDICLLYLYVLQNRSILPATPEDMASELLPSLSISKETIKKLLYVWWTELPSGYERYLAQKAHLCATTGQVLRIDHTYKFVKAIGIHDNKKWVYSFC